MNIKKITVIDNILYHYIIRSDSITEQNKETTISEFVELNFQLYNYLKINNYNYLKQNYYIMFHSIMSNRYKQSTEYDVLMSMQNICRKIFLRDNLVRIVINAKRASHVLKINKNELAYINLKYYLYSGRGIGYKISRRLLNIYMEMKKQIKYLPDKLWKKNIYLIGTEDCGNLGDHMIAVAELKFIKDNFEGRNIIECPLKQYRNNLNDMKYRIKSSDIIFLTGGGNMGDLYPFSEAVRESVIKLFGKNRIIIFPQTVFFEDKKNIQHSQDIYQKAERLVIATRERYSYDLCKEVYKGINIIEVPDIVLYLEMNSDLDRTTLRMCLRNDMEKTMSDKEYELLLRHVNSLGEEVEKFDMQLDYDISIAERDKYLKEIIKKYQTAKLIITDRLHGMILSAISGTPCVAIGSKSYKMKGTYEWLKDLPYIKYIEDVDDVPAAIKRVMSVTDKRYDNKKLVPYFERIIYEMN